jgi:hypothetical protein
VPNFKIGMNVVNYISIFATFSIFNQPSLLLQLLDVGVDNKSVLTNMLRTTYIVDAFTLNMVNLIVTKNPEKQ